MKLKSSLRRLCSSCYMVRRQGRLFVYCKSNPRHKQRQGRGPRRKLHTLGLEDAAEGQQQPMLGGLLKHQQHQPHACGCGGHHAHHHHAASSSASYSIPRPLIPAASSPLDMMATWLTLATPTLRSLGARLRALLPGGSQRRV